jgi:hypothetical protein
MFEYQYVDSNKYLRDLIISSTLVLLYLPLTLEIGKIIEYFTCEGRCCWLSILYYSKSGLPIFISALRFF